MFRKHARRRGNPSTRRLRRTVRCFLFQNSRSGRPLQGFHRNEHYTTLDLTDTLRRILHRGTPVYGLYGADDGLYSAAQLDALRNLLGPDHMITLDSCSHNVFIDRRHAFIETLTRHCKTK